MVSLKQRQDLAALSEADPQLRKIELLLNGESAAGSDFTSGDVREELLVAISSNDSARFKEKAAKIGQRKISPESDWCSDDYLLFLLLLGNQKFGKPLKFLAGVIEARRQNPNPSPRKINEVFGALERGEFGIEGEFGFLKIPFLQLAGNLRLGPAEARKAIAAMSKPGLQDQMSPFLRLLTQKAYDLVLTERQPVATETTAQLIEALEAHAKDFSLKHWWRVIVALPGRVVLSLVAGILGLGLIPVLFGVGKGLVESHESQKARKRPAELAVAAVHEPTGELPPEVLMLAMAMTQQAPPSTNKCLSVEIEGAPFNKATPSFTVEASHLERPIKSALAFTEPRDEGTRPVTILPLQRDHGRVRALVPEQGAGQRICFILEFEGGTNDTVQSVGKGVVLRPLQ